MRYVLDTNVLSEPLRPRADQGVVERLQEHQGNLAIPAIVWHELLYGAFRLPPSAKRTAIERYIREVVARSMPILPYDARAAEWHASERSRLAAIGLTPPFADGQIAAVAQVNNLTLVTMNISDYAHFRDLQVEDWRL